MKGSQLRNKILETVEREWPISITQVALSLGIHQNGSHERKRKAAVSKIIYHIIKLKGEGKVYTKKIGGALVIWPTNIEKLRVIRELLEGV